MTFMEPVLSKVEGKDEASATADRMTFYEAVTLTCGQRFLKKGTIPQWSKWERR
jgi:hypothetical protein